MKTFETLLRGEKAEATFREQLSTRRQLKRIAKTLTNLPDGVLPVSRAECETFDWCSRSWNIGKAMLCSLQDGVALLYSTKGFLEYRSHRFIFPEDGEPAYHRDSYNVDCQAIGSGPINAMGADELTKDRNIAVQVNFVHGVVQMSSASGWSEYDTICIRTAQC